MGYLPFRFNQVKTKMEVISMKVYVAIDTFQGVVNDAKVFMTEQSAKKAEKQWLDEVGIKTEDSRNCKADDGTSFFVQECDLKP